MLYRIENADLMREHGLRRSTSRERPFQALTGGRCVGCAKVINPGDTIQWHRKYGIYHQGCQTGGARVDADAVREVVEALLREQGVAGARTPVAEVDEAKIKRLVEAALSERVPVDVRVHKLDGKTTTVKDVHALFPKLLFLISRRQHIYLYGPPGSGKSTGPRLAAEALGWQFGMISLNPQTPESKLFGFIDANGVYRETVYFKCYTQGGVFVIDEMDNCSASLLTTLNSQLDNGIGAFPHGVFKRHENFVCVATGNTTGRGANPMFPERRVFDAAFAERFVYMHWPYDEKMERAVALKINPKATKWVDWVQSVRRFAAENDPKLVVSPRASFKIAEFVQFNDLTPEEVVEVALFKGIEEHRKSRALSACPLPKEVVA